MQKASKNVKENWHNFPRLLMTKMLFMAQRKGHLLHAERAFITT